MTKSLRRLVLREWRGLPEDSRPDRTVTAAEAVQSLVSRLGLSERINEGDILAAWREVVGEFIAQHSKPTRLVDGILHIQVLQPSVRYELDRTWRPEILKKLRAQFGARTVKDLRFRT
jgi:predicted nucleic acid-binding Zn ribbon protein